MHEFKPALLIFSFCSCFALSACFLKAPASKGLANLEATPTSISAFSVSSQMSNEKQSAYPILHDSHPLGGIIGAVPFINISNDWVGYWYFAHEYPHSVYGKPSAPIKIDFSQRYSLISFTKDGLNLSTSSASINFKAKGDSFEAEPSAQMDILGEIGYLELSMSLDPRWDLPVPSSSNATESILKGRLFSPSGEYLGMLCMAGISKSEAEGGSLPAWKISKNEFAPFSSGIFYLEQPDSSKGSTYAVVYLDDQGKPRILTISSCSSMQLHNNALQCDIFKLNSGFAWPTFLQIDQKNHRFVDVSNKFIYYYKYLLSKYLNEKSSPDFKYDEALDFHYFQYKLYIDGKLNGLDENQILEYAKRKYSQRWSKYLKY